MGLFNGLGWVGYSLGRRHTEDYEDCDAVGEGEEFVEQMLGGDWRGFLDVRFHLGCVGDSG